MRGTICSVVLLLVLVLGLILPQSALGQPNYTWIPTGTDYWDISTNWNNLNSRPDAYPYGSGDYALISNGGTAVIRSDFAGSALYAVINGGSTVRQDSGIANIQYVLPGNSGTSNTYILNNTASLTTGNVTINQGGVGTFQQNGGTHTAGTLIIGNNSNALPATYNLVGGVLTASSDVDIANSSSITSGSKAIFNQTGGTVSLGASATLRMGSSMTGTNGSAIYDLHGGTLTLSKASTPFVFTLANGAVAGQIDFDFAAGGNPTSTALILNGAWTPTSLLAIANSYFTVGGVTATPSMLTALAGTGSNGVPSGFTSIYAPVPEPSTVLLVTTGVGCAVLISRRRRRTEQS